MIIPKWSLGAVMYEEVFIRIYQVRRIFYP